MANPYVLDFAPVNNALAGWQKKNQFDQQMGMKQQQFEATNALAQGQFGLQKQAADRAAAEAARMEQTRGAVTNWLAGAQGLEGIPQPLVELSRIQGDATPVQSYLLAKAKGGLAKGEYNKNPIYGTRVGPDGKPQTVMLQAGSQGDATETRLPEGVTVNAQKPIEVDAGTHTVLLDPITRQPIAQIPKNVGEVARQREVGGETGKAQVNLPTVESNAKQLFDYVDNVANDKNLDRMLGYGGYLPNVSTQARTLQSKISQLTNSSFLMAFERLKGGGAITETEGRKATEAMSRLQEMVQSGQDYREALRDFRGEVARLLEVAKRKAGVGGPNGNAGFQGQAPASGGWSVKRLD